MTPLFSIVFDPIHLVLAGNEAMHKYMDELEFRPDPTTELAALESIKIDVSTVSW